MQRFFLFVTGLLGTLEGLLVARLVLRVLAARPENPVFATLFAITAPLRAPLAALDTGQPRFGAVLEFSTLATCALVAVALLAAAFASRSVSPKELA